MGYGSVLFRHTVTHTPYTGEGGVGPTFGDPASLRCRFREERKVIRTSDGDEVIADATLQCDASETISVQDKVAKGNRNYRVAEVVPAELLGSTNHLEVRLAAD